MDLTFLGRQPIFTAELEVFAYELLFRSGADTVTADVMDGDEATASVVLNLLTDIGLERVVDDKRAFINMTSNLLLRADLACLPAERIVLEVLEDVDPTPEIIAAVRRLAAAGFTIALDDVVYRHELEPLIEVAHIVKVDLPRVPTGELSEHVAALSRYGVQLLAEKVETQAEFDECRQLGFHLFQGYFFCRPQILSERRVAGSELAVMRLLAELQDPGITPDRIENLLNIDPTLSFHVLRLVNSSASGLERRIESIRHAAIVMGVQRIRSLASMMLLASVAQSKPRELLQVALTRAKLCELLARRAGEARYDRPFTVGLLSVLDAILDRPMAEVVALLPLAPDMNDALIDRSGPLGELLQTVLAYEGGVASEDALTFQGVRLTANDYLVAVEWAKQSLRAET